MEEYKRILVPVDGSDLSKLAFENALVLAKVFGSKVELLHVTEYVSNVLGISSMMGFEISQDQVKEHLEKNANELIEKYKKISKGKGIDTKSKIIIGNPANEIIEASKDYDLIIMGSHGIGGLLNLLIGGTAEKVVRHACCPVFLVRKRTGHCEN